MGKFRYTNIGIPAAKGLFRPVNSVLGREPSWVNLVKYTAMRKLVDLIWQLLHESYAEPIKCIELIPGEPEYMSLIDS